MSDGAQLVQSTCFSTHPFCGGRTAKKGRKLETITAQAKANKTKRVPFKQRGTRTIKAPAREGIKKKDEKKGNQFYFNFTGFPFPLGPVLSRPTVRSEVDKGRIWLFEQQQALAFSNVTTNIRMTVVKLKSGGLWVHAPIAPTQECVRLVEELGCPVEYIVLPTFAYEHKVFVAPFSRKFPSAEVHTAPRQWSWPIPLPLQAVGIFPTATLEDDDERTPWAAEIKQKVFSSSVGFGPYSEVAFFDVRSKTLIVTDAVIQVPSQPPEGSMFLIKSNTDAFTWTGAELTTRIGKVIPESALQNSGRRVPFPISTVCRGDNQETPPPPEDPSERRILGWMRMALLILYFTPYDLLTPKESFEAVADKLFVSPVVRTLVFTKASREEVRDWVTSICRDWEFSRIIPAHFAAPIASSPAEFKKAFRFLFDEAEEIEEVPPKGFFAGLLERISPKRERVQTEFPYNDMRGLRALESVLQKTNVINKP